MFNKHSLSFFVFAVSLWFNGLSDLFVSPISIKTIYKSNPLVDINLDYLSWGNFFITLKLTNYGIAMVSYNRRCIRLACRQLWKGAGFGFIGNIIAGIVGGIVGGWLAGKLGIGGGGLLWQILIAAGGAWLVLFVISLIKKA